MEHVSQAVRDRLVQWDSKLAPLSDKQKQGFVELSSAASYRPLPSEVDQREDSRNTRLFTMRTQLNPASSGGGAFITGHAYQS